VHPREHRDRNARFQRLLGNTPPLLRKRPVMAVFPV
jgi:hypothetical protein